MRYETQGEVWAMPTGGWHLLTLPSELTAGLKALRGPNAVAFGSMRVQATIGATTWRTSIFPDTKRGAFLLPVKAEVRRREGITAGDVVPVVVELLL